MEIQTTNDINEWFSGHIESYQKSLLDYKDKNLDEQNVLLGKCTNKKWISFEKEEIRQLFSFMTFGYGEHKDFRNVGTDYEGRDKVFQMIKELNDNLQKDE